MLLGAALIFAVAVIWHAGTPAYAAGSVRSAVEVQLPMLDVDLYDAPGRDRKMIKSIPGAEFPAEVEYIGTEITAGRMHHIRLESQPGDYWVDGNEVWISAYDGEIEVFCDADQSRALGNTGRGAGGRSTCRAK
ncbi:hypothetical protein [Thalassospira marina]|uniref:Uncharacterized protein n=1 Tax=Thalassospira marina TaxID=2048283 RepID=A0A2N3KSD9_9PROT|nr:hypothetical protein [Thalassospira marina]AUG51401.1 hypothetical protein CSC3H3_00710 [Thalassospira marina]PKR53499.1 hypothetical protein COO20_13225 [Thalassospira marina]